MVNPKNTHMGGRSYYHPAYYPPTCAAADAPCVQAAQAAEAEAAAELQAGLYIFAWVVCGLAGLLLLCGLCACCSRCLRRRQEQREQRQANTNPIAKATLVLV
jgi:heme/copper-type cytochrome/quinol oxidase subunit 2